LSELDSRIRAAILLSLTTFSCHILVLDTQTHARTHMCVEDKESCFQPLSSYRSASGIAAWTSDIWQ
jgi:hypothetical protein